MVCVCLTISFRVAEVLSNAKVHLYLGSHWAAVSSVALVAGFALVYNLQAGDWARVSTLAKHYFSTYISTTVWCQVWVQYATQGFSE